MRGEHPQKRGAVFDYRFIPACAGNAARHHPRYAARTVHPRMRGERNEQSACSHRASRFIPACAGNAVARTQPQVPRDGSSPHARGTDRLVMIVARKFGSSPHARGTRKGSILQGASIGSSPHARGTRRHHSSRLDTVHPRMRGEHDRRVMRDIMEVGSSPHARGTPRRAGAASTAMSVSSPHARGTRRWRARTPSAAAVSSPHARGTPGCAQ